MTVPSPRFLFLQVNKRCNLRCQHCDFWMRKSEDVENYLGGERLRRVINEFAIISRKGAVVICGGEPMLNLDRYFDICRFSREAGLRIVSVVNGTRIRDAAMADRLIAEGPHEISISLNSHRKELHDRTRGVTGAFDKAVAALRLLVKARAHAGAKTHIDVMGLIFDENHCEIEEFYDFVLNDVGADKLKLNFLQPSFGHDNGEPDAFFAQHGKVDPDATLAAIRRSNARFKLGLNPIWLKQVEMYLRELGAAQDLDKGWGSHAQTSEHICNTHDRNIMVDHYGTARLCFANDFRGMKLEHYGDLKTFWDGANDIREKMRTCNRFCGISHSVRRETSSVRSRATTQDVGMFDRLRVALTPIGVA
jgi:MoaA/NifB/PqqE/SkfB family radical SAM enzyme